MTISNGVWFDTKNSKVVDSPPEEGVQIVAPGAEMTPALQADIDRWTDVQNGVESTPKTVGTKGNIETAAATGPVETAADTSKSKK